MLKKKIIFLCYIKNFKISANIGTYCYILNIHCNHHLHYTVAVSSGGIP